jgi:penicillin-binding protein 1A
MQQAADQVISQDLPYNGPNSPVASMVTIDNRTGEVRAMVGGPIVNGQEDYDKYPFNIATEGERQPGSAFKPFTLAVALEAGFGPDSLFLSAPASFVVPNSGGKEIFHVRNFGNTYSGVITLQDATDISDNSVFSRLGIDGLGPTGTRRVAAMANAAGITTPVSTNPAMIIGGLTIGVSPLDMAHAYETIADGGRRMYNPTLGSPDEGPTGIAQISWGNHLLRDVPIFKRVMPASIAQEVGTMLTGVVQQGSTGSAAAISGVDVAGKTGTTTNYGDAWFVGWTPQLTTAVWVGFPNKLVPMTTLYNGGPVEGGTFPAVIWHDFMVQALQILASEQPPGKKTSTTSTTATTPTVSAPVTVPSAPPATTATATTPITPTTATGTGTTTPTGAGAGTGNTNTPAPTQTPPAAPPPQATPPPANPPPTGTGTGTGTGAGTGPGGGTGSGTGTGSSSGGSGTSGGSGGANIGGTK